MQRSPRGYVERPRKGLSYYRPRIRTRRRANSTAITPIFISPRNKRQRTSLKKSFQLHHRIHGDHEDDCV